MLRRRFPQIHAPKKEDICYATSNRQWAVKEMLAEIDLLLVIGSRNSSNSNRLVDVARASGVAGHLIDDETEIDERWLEGVRTVGISSGASAPERLVDAALRLVPRPRRRADRAVPDGRARTSRSSCRSSCGASCCSPSGSPSRPGPQPSTFAIAGSLPPFASTATASVSALIQSACSSRSASAAGSVSAMRSVSSRPASLRIELTRWISSYTRPSRASSSSTRGVERDGDARVAGDGPAVLAGPLDEHLVRLELVAGGAKAAALELLERARLQRGAHRAELLAELRPEHRQVRLDAQLGIDRAELDLLHAQLLGDLVGVRGGERRALDDDPAQRLAQLEAGR